MTPSDHPVRLTDYSHGAGCACKLSPADLRTVLGMMQAPNVASDPNLLVGFDKSDDAAVYQVRGDLAIVVTTDFFTPIVDDAYDWGRIAATNALSDIYAMGADPLLALNLVAWPREGIPFEVLARVLDGGGHVVREAGALIGGGHSIDDTEPKYGLAVVGTAHPESIWRNSGAQMGDVLVLTKPIGLGAISTAIKRGAASASLIETAVTVMTTLNASGRDAARAVGVNAATDVTGFGLLGHAREMLSGSGLAGEIQFQTVPAIDGALELINAGMVAGGTQRNHAYLSDTESGLPSINWGPLSEDQQFFLADAQTSGGLLFAVEPDRANALIAALKEHKTLAAAIIGKCVAGEAGAISITE